MTAAIRIRRDGRVGEAVFANPPNNNATVDLPPRLAAEIAGNAPLALAATRKTLRDNLLNEVTGALAREHAQQSLMRETEDCAEGVRAVAKRRAGRLVGQ